MKKVEREVSRCDGNKNEAKRLVEVIENKYEAKGSVEVKENKNETKRLVAVKGQMKPRG